MELKLLHTRRMSEAEIAFMRGRPSGVHVFSRRSVLKGAGAGLVAGVSGLLVPRPATAQAARAIYMFASGISLLSDVFTVIGGIQGVVDLFNEGSDAERQTMMGTLTDDDGAIEDQNGWNVLVEPGYTQAYQISASPRRAGNKGLTCSTQADSASTRCDVVESN